MDAHTSLKRPPPRRYGPRLPLRHPRHAEQPSRSRHAEPPVYIFSSQPLADQHSLWRGRRTGGYLDELHTLPEKGFQRTHHGGSAADKAEVRGPVAHQHTPQVETKHHPPPPNHGHTGPPAAFQRSASHKDKHHGGTVTEAGSSHGTTPDAADAPKKPSGEDGKAGGPVEDKKAEEKKDGNKKDDDKKDDEKKSDEKKDDEDKKAKEKKDAVDKKGEEKTDVKDKEDSETAGQGKKRVKKDALGKLSHGIMNYPLLSLGVYASALTAANAAIVAAAIKNKEDRVMRAKKEKSELPVAIPAIPPSKHEADDVYQSASPGGSTVGPGW